jgi:tetratricopeptide (TPR) repeat protein
MKKEKIQLIRTRIGEKGNLFFDKPSMTEEAYDRAIEMYSQTIQDTPANPFGYYKRGEIYVYQGDYDRGIADLDQAVKLDPNQEIGRAHV